MRNRLALLVTALAGCRQWGRVLLWLFALIIMLPIVTLHAETEDDQVVAPNTLATATTQPVESQPLVALPHLRINREKKYVEFDATVATRESQWIELLVCTKGTREYESILTTQARPSHIHLALLILGVVPGSPLKWYKKEDEMLPIAPTGAAVKVSLRYQKKDKWVEVPAGQWVMDRANNQTWNSSTWLFAGSQFVKTDTQQVYLADANGSCISLVNFGDDLLTRPTNTTNHNDGGQLAANTAIIPPEGTAVIVRLTPLPAQPATSTQPTTQPSSAIRN